MTQLERLYKLNKLLLEEMPQYRKNTKYFGNDESSQFLLFRSLVNVRPPINANSDFLEIQDEYLQLELRRRGITDIKNFNKNSKGLYLWKGDITTLKCDAIVNAANSKMLGCFYPNHTCIDNAIHTYAGIQLRLDCANLMKKQDHDEKIGNAKITPAYNLPSRYVLHTVGPIINDVVEKKDKKLLASCYISCLKLAEKYNLKSIAFCCISTGEFHFPNDEAANIAIETVKKYKKQTQSEIEVIFNVFKELDYNIYQKLLQ